MFSILVLLLLLICLSAFFSLSESALTSISKYRIKKLLILKKISKDILTKWLIHPQYLLTTILVGDTIVNIIISITATILFIRLLSNIINKELIELISWLIITFITIIFCEITPKIYGRNNPEYVTIKSIRLLNFIMKLFAPLVNPLIFLINRFVPDMSFIFKGSVSKLTMDELKNIISDSNNRGLIQKETGSLLEGIFKIDKLKVSEIMIPADRVDVVDISDLETNPDNVIDRLIEIGHSRIPVYKNDRNKIIGIILIKDIAFISMKGDNRLLENIIRPAYFIPVDKKVSELLHEFQKGITHCAVVIDKNNKFTGFVTLENIIEEIVGEILDEYDLSEVNRKI